MSAIGSSVPDNSAHSDPAMIHQARPDHNRIGIDFHQPMPRPPVRGKVVDFHLHLISARHAPEWFSVLDHFGIDYCLTMTPLEEALAIQRQWGQRVGFIAIPQWGRWGQDMIDNWLRRIEAFYNLGSRIAKFWCAPTAIGERGWRLDSPQFRPLFQEVTARKMAIMTHIGDPDLWYAGRYADPKYGSRDDHYQMWENVLGEYGQTGLPWIGAHLGGNPENLGRLQSLLERYPNLYLDASATKWIAREISARRDEARDFFLRFQGRLLFGSDLVTSDDRGWDFLASRFWTLRKLWETGYIGPSPIFDPDLAEDHQPTLRGLALPDMVLQRFYHDNAAAILKQIGTPL